MYKILILLFGYMLLMSCQNTTNTTFIYPKDSLLNGPRYFVYDIKENSDSYSSVVGHRLNKEGNHEIIVLDYNLQPIEKFILLAGTDKIISGFNVATNAQLVFKKTSWNDFEYSFQVGSDLFSYAEAKVIGDEKIIEFKKQQYDAVVFQNTITSQQNQDHPQKYSSNGYLVKNIGLVYEKYVLKEYSLEKKLNRIIDQQQFEVLKNNHLQNDFKDQFIEGNHDDH